MFYPRRDRIIQWLIWLGLALLSVFSLLVNAKRQNLAIHQFNIVISEFMASNQSTLTDQDGQFSDWIEIHNSGNTSVDLDGWYLCDDDNDLRKWRFPAITLPADGYLIVFASGQDRAVVDSELHTNFKLDRDGEYLALVQPDGVTIAYEYAPETMPESISESGSPEYVFYAQLGRVVQQNCIESRYPVQFQDISYGLDTAMNHRYFSQPTPGGANRADLGPFISGVSHTPVFPSIGDTILVTTTIKALSAPVAKVSLVYRIMFGNEVTIPMLDDGLHADRLAGDGTYGAAIPNRGYRPGDMVRYYVSATDENGLTSRKPLFSGSANLSEYRGMVIVDPDVSSVLPTLYWFVQDPDAARTDSGTHASLFYCWAEQPDCRFYDNVVVRRRGRTSKDAPKKNYKFDFNQGHYFQFSPDQDPVEEFNLNTNFSDKAYIRQILSFETYRDAGVPYSISFPVRVQQNGDFYGVFIFVEQPDERYLERQGLDPDGALYKMHNALDSATGDRVEKRTRLDEDNSDLQALIDGLGLEQDARTAYVFDHVNIPAVVNYLAATTLIHDGDCGHKNYYLYRDTKGTQEWMFLPWDKDLTFGRVNVGHILNDEIWADHDPQSYPLTLEWNRLIDVLYKTPAIREMYLRRLRTLMDLLLQPPGTPVVDRYYEQRIDELVVQMQPDVRLDADKWPLTWGTPQTFAQAVGFLKTDYLAARRIHLYGNHSASHGGIVPNAQPSTAHVDIDQVKFSPASGNQDDEFLTLRNHNDFAVDISGWTVACVAADTAGSKVRYTFQPGVVIPAGGTLYVSPNVVAFRSRATSPKGGEGRFVQGNYRGRLPNLGGILVLYNEAGKPVARRIFGFFSRQ
ncbi:MAG: CotH kinase family protein [Anaerolineae bacterium]|nr:CotH kinase family protein [Anaerolineae bacterium]